MKYCSECNREFSDASRFCADCGVALTETVRAEAGPPNSAGTESFGSDGAGMGPVRTENVQAGNPGNSGAGTGPVRPESVRAGTGGLAASAAVNQKIESHMIKSIITTVCCCMPFGIAAIVFASKVDSLQTAGNYNAAIEASKKANLWSNVAIGMGALYVLFVMLFYGIILSTMTDLFPALLESGFGN